MPAGAGAQNEPRSFCRAGAQRGGLGLPGDLEVLVEHRRKRGRFNKCQAQIARGVWVTSEGPRMTRKAAGRLLTVLALALLAALVALCDYIKPAETLPGGFSAVKLTATRTSTARRSGDCGCAAPGSATT